MEEKEEAKPVGRPRNIESPEQLWKLFRQYKNWAKTHPREKQEFVGKDGDEKTRKLERPLTWVEFESYLFERMIINDLGDYERNKEGRYDQFTTIVRAIKNVIEADQFGGAAVGIYQHNIIARKLGLADKQEARRVDKDGNDLMDSPIISVVLPEGMNIDFPSNLTDENPDG